MSNVSYLMSETTTFDTWARQKGYSQTTRRKIAAGAERFCQWLEKENLQPEHVREADVLAYLRECKKTQSQRSQQITLHHISTWYTWQTDQELTDRNPAALIKIHGVKRSHLYSIIPHEELENIHRSYPQTTPAEKRNRCILGLMIHQAIRTEELERLTLSDLNLREGTITIHGSRRSAKRIMKLEAHQIIELMDYTNETRKIILNKVKELAARKGHPERSEGTVEGQGHPECRASRGSEGLFISSGSSSHIGNLMQQLMNQLRAQHSFLTDAKQIRASVIVNWLKQHNLRKVQYMAGHRYISSTEAYKQNDVTQLQEELGRYHPMI